eukprot:CAMPEP_0185725130 /NCGR_PEP_ID=MMETSP1171-20130828/1449_1 /TAXON_ID=374046 /ORGANISM="Helicotheca tamensis, Strain CCMP826" /LENGTH=572 /DNA_ID=CAMNT_0028393167 /DNA_START=91 /DNA_END=1809 /DNA_ORIENTATION=-
MIATSNIFIVIVALLTTAIRSTSAEHRRSGVASTEQLQQHSYVRRKVQSSSYCGCDACTNKILSTRAGGVKCGDRIEFKESSEGGSLSRADACAFVANEWPDICGPCECAAPVTTPVPTTTTTPPTTTTTTTPPTTTTTTTTITTTTTTTTAAPITTTTTAAPVTTTTTTTLPPPLYCGCYDCAQVWDTLAGIYTCGARITYKESPEGGSLSHSEACAFVSDEFPSICGPACHPSSCDRNDCLLYEEPFEPDPITIPPATPNSLALTDSLYCFPEYAQRSRYESAWGSYVIEAKDGNAAACGPGDNYFSSDTVSYDSTSQELTLEYKKIGATWTGSEVRILRTSSPDYNGITFPYGTFSFSLKSVSVLDDQSNVLSASLPSDIVLGMFTWDTKEDYSQHENYNHEVDIEVSQWGDPNNADVQFLTQPWDEPGPHFTPRFFSGGTEGTYDQGGHTYEFTWNPNEIIWYTDAGTGTSRVYSTTTARESCNIDYIQCLPSNTEVRINLWNMGSGNDGLRPDGIASDSDRVVVVIDNFTFTESSETHVMDGGACSKHCQCSDTSSCLSGFCVPITS